jgi:hypothetical protein
MLRSVEMFCFRIRHWAVAFAFLLTAAADVLARAKRDVKPPKEPVYPLEYAVVIFVVLISLAVVLRPGRRTDLVDEIKLPFGPKA